MDYLIFQLWLCLLIMFLLGLVVGLLLCRCLKQCEQKKTPADVNKNNNFKTVTAPIVAAAQTEPTEVDLDTAVNLDSSVYNIETLEGIGPKTGDAFRREGIATVGDYLCKLNTPSARTAFAEKLGFKTDILNAWASMADLLRIDGVEHQQAELLNAVNIKTVADLAASNADQLTQKMVEVNAAGKQKIAPQVPDALQVAGWVSIARGTKEVVVV